MLDYRQRSSDSPFAWCVKHQQLVPVENVIKVMTTAYRVTKTGIFPYAVCDGACVTKTVVSVPALETFEQIPAG